MFGTRPALAVSAFPVTNVMATCDLALNASAQTPSISISPSYWDRWNPNWIQLHVCRPGQMGPGIQRELGRNQTGASEAGKTLLSPATKVRAVPSGAIPEFKPEGLELDW